MAGAWEFCGEVPVFDKIIDKDFVTGTPVKAGNFTVIPIISVTYGAGADHTKGGFFGRLSPRAVIVIEAQEVRVFNLGHGAVPEEVVGELLKAGIKPDRR